MQFPKIPALSKRQLKPIIVLSLSLVLPLIFFTVYELLSTTRIYFGVYINKIPLRGQTVAEATANLDQVLNASPSATLKFSYKNQTKSVSLVSLGFNYDASASARQAFKIGRQGSRWQNLKTRFSLFFHPVSLQPKYHLNTLEEEKLFLELHAMVDQPPVFPQLRIENEEVAISQGRPGQVLNETSLRAELQRRFGERRLNSPIPLPVETINPIIDQSQITKAQRLIANLFKQPLKLTGANQSFTLTAQEVLGFIQLNNVDYGVTSNDNRMDIFAPIPELTASPQPKVVDPKKVSAYLKNTIAPAVYQPSKDAVLQVKDGRATVFTPSQEGRRLDLERATSLLTNYLEEQSQTPPDKAVEAPALLDLPIITTPANIPTPAVNNLGIETLIGRGVSHFRGSIANRIYNIELAASRFNGILIEPGAEVSFNEILGEVSAATGFKQAYVIKQGRTVLDDGGGVCQTSTTLFRAVMDAGLPITERVAHAYRVAYYEQGFDPGLDATVYAPSVDLRFKNDTPAYLLIQTKVDRSTSTLIYEIYGTDDGRKSQISKPVVTNVQPPPKPLYQDDPTLPKGTTKQVDWAAWGAKVTYTYSVTRGGEIIFSKTFTSNYRPWQAVYLVGTKEG